LSIELNTEDNANSENRTSHCLLSRHSSVKKTKFWSKLCMNVKITILVKIRVIFGVQFERRKAHKKANLHQNW